MTFDSRTLRLGLVLGLVLATFGGTRAAHAQEPGAPAPVDDERERKAKDLYEQGNTHYDLAEYDKAIELFKQAYAVSRRPTLLYNIAQAYRMKGDCEQALQVYKNYVRVDPGSTLRPKVESRIAEMETCVKDPTRKPVGPEAIQKDPSTGDIAKPPGDETHAALPPVRPPQPSERAPGGGTKKILGLVTGAVGVAAIGTGVYFSLQASDKADELAAACPEAMPCDWDDEHKAIESDGQAAERNALILYAVGGAAVVGGVVLYILGSREAAAVPQVAFVPLRGGGAVAAAWTF